MSLGNWRNRILAPAIAAAGVPAFTPYQLRHTCASLLIHQGEPLTYVADQLGHSVAVLEDHYAHVIAEHRRARRVRSMSEEIAAARGLVERRLRVVGEGAA